MSGPTRDSGAVAVEMALLLPVLLIALGAVVDLSVVLRVQVQLQEVAQEGAAYAMAHPTNPAGTRQRAVEASPGLAIDQVTVTCSQSNPEVVSVRVAHSHRWMLGLLSDSSLAMTAEASGDVMSMTSCVGG